MNQIQQEIQFNAKPEAVYNALTNGSEFAAFTEAPAKIDAVDGGAFICFGEFILGRNVELVSNQSIVQAWRVFNWPDGVYSIVRFQLLPEGEGTRLVMSQNGVPEDAVGHVDGGWDHKYWQPLKQYLQSA